MRSLIASDVSSIESTYSLPAEDIFGSGGQPRARRRHRHDRPDGHDGPDGQVVKKCKRARSRKKRRRCAKRVKARARSAV